jgi:multidrug resistance efflux pump
MVLKQSVRVALFFIALIVGSQAWSPAWSQQFVLEQLIVVPIDQIAVPARATGTLAEVAVREGEAVLKDTLLARLDDAQAGIEAQRAATQLEIFMAMSASNVDIDLARKTLDRAEKAARVQSINREMASRKADNEFRVQAAQKAEAVAINELQRAVEARKVFNDSVSRSEIDGLTLAMQRSRLETQQAIFDQQQDQLLAKAEAASSDEQSVAIEQSRFGIEKALNDQSIAKLKVKAAQHEADLAALTVQRHRLQAPWDGVVTKIHRRPGQWVEIGEPVIELLRLDRLRAEGYVAKEMALKLKPSAEVSLVIYGEPEARAKLGTIVFVNPEVDPVNGEVQFWIEFDNIEKNVLPGMRMNAKLIP